MFNTGGPTCAPAKKIVLDAALSAELENASGQTAVTIVGRVLGEAATKGLDAVVFSAAAATAAAPAGLLNGVTAIPSGGGTRSQFFPYDRRISMKGEVACVTGPPAFLESGRRAVSCYQTP
jgi:hypothetical protein